MPRIRSAVVAALLLAVVGLNGQQAARVFVVGAAEVVELDGATFAAARRIPLPKEVAGVTGGLAVSRGGQMLSCPPRAEGRPCWVFDGLAGRSIARPARGPLARAVDSSRSAPWCVLAADGRGVFWFENEYRVAGDRDDPAGSAPSVSVAFRAWRTNLAGAGDSPVATVAFEPCRCATGACEETCPEAAVWTPDRGVDDFFIVSRWIPGQLTAAYQSSAVYRKTSDGWTATPLPRPLETVLDAGQGGGAIVHAVNDTGCCGWMNESADRTWLLRNGRNVPLFDERGEYGNDDYDVSFYTPNASFSPGGRQVAMTIASTLARGEEVRLLHDGTADPPELQRVRRAAAGLPAVVVADIAGTAARRVARIRRATLVGWLDETRLLLRREKTFEAWDVRAGTGTRVAIPDGARVLVR